MLGKMKNGVFFLFICSAAIFMNGCCNDFKIEQEVVRVDLTLEKKEGLVSFLHFQSTLDSGGNFRPLALTVADFNGDHTSDLLTGVQDASGIGRLMLYPAISPQEIANIQQPEAAIIESWLTTPFHLEAKAFDMPLRPDFLFAADVNHDRFQDVILAQKGFTSLYWIPGDGTGEFNSGEFVSLEGSITSLFVGEFNRIDEIADVAIGIRTSEGSKLIVFEGDKEKIFQEPKVFPFSKDIEEIVSDDFDGDRYKDLAILSSGKLWLLLGHNQMMRVGELELKRIRVPFSIKAMASGHFQTSGRTQLALLSENGKVHAVSFRNDPKLKWSHDVIAKGSWPEATKLRQTRITGHPLDDLLLMERQQLHILTAGKNPSRYQQVELLKLSGDPTAVLSARLNHDALYDLIILENNAPLTLALTQPQAVYSINFTTDESDADPGDSVCDIDLILAGNQCTLRAAIEQANTNPGMDTIDFLAVNGLTVSPNSQLPVITDPITFQQSIASETLEIDGSNAAASNGLGVTSGSSTFRGLIINRFDDSPFSVGIVLAGNGNNIVTDCFIGTDRTGTLDFGNSRGILISDSSNNSIADENVISGNQIMGIELAGNSFSNTIEHTRIGTDLSGTIPVGNLFGIDMSPSVSDTTIRFSIIAANDGPGVRMFTGNTLDSNNIGAGTIVGPEFGNGSQGIAILGEDNLVMENIVCSNGSAGISIQGSTVLGNMIQQNWIGTNLSGTQQLGNAGGGILVQDGSRNIFTGSPRGNIIAFNQLFGIRITEVFGTSQLNALEQNLIYSNSGLGIDLGNDNNVTPNDPGDPDSGPNHLQNFPVITSATSNGNEFGVAGTLNSLPNSSFKIQVFASPGCDSSGHGEGEVLAASTTFDVDTDSDGNGTFAVTVLNANIPVGWDVAATASLSVDGQAVETSEFSACFQVEPSGGGLSCRVLDDDVLDEDEYEIGTDISLRGEVLDQNNVPAPGIPVTFRIITSSGSENVASGVTDEDGMARTPVFSSAIVGEDTIRMEGDGFSCETIVLWRWPCPDESSGLVVGLGFAQEVIWITEHKDELIRLQQFDPMLKKLTESVLAQFKVEFPRMTKSGSLELSQSQVDLIRKLAQRYAEKASDPLQRKLRSLKEDLANPEFFKARGVTLKQE